jgi:GrpB-like predicted nucleotidyltransferase (UPF0157 family)
VGTNDSTDLAAYEERLKSTTVSGRAQPLTRPIEIHDYNPQWPRLYQREEDRLRLVLGERALRIEHAGSTSVPELPAKPIIDAVLEVADSSDEAAYAAHLEAAGYTMTIREPDWYQHRLFRGPDTNINLHVFSACCEETVRMIAFRDWLRHDKADRDLYARTKRELAGR